MATWYKNTDGDLIPVTTDAIKVSKSAAYEVDSTWFVDVHAGSETLKVGTGASEILATADAQAFIDWLVTKFNGDGGLGTIVIIDDL